VAKLSEIRSIFNQDQGGSYSNEYEMNLIIPSGSPVEEAATRAGFAAKFTGSKFQNMLLMCDEASLPGTFAATNEIDGMFTGRMIQYAHGKLYNDIRLSFIQTNQMNPQKFFESWFYSMFPERRLNSATGGPLPFDAFDGDNRLDRTNVVTIEYYENIVCDMTVTKTYRDQFNNNSKQSIIYSFKNVYPYSIESVPLSYGASTLNKLRVAFRYEKHVASF